VACSVLVLMPVSLCGAVPQEKLEAVRDSIGGQVGELQTGLQRRQAVAAARELLELMQDTAHVMSKVDKLLGEVKAAGEGALGRVALTHSGGNAFRLNNFRCMSLYAAGVYLRVRDVPNGLGMMLGLMGMAGCLPTC
jgi:hypothetical protein